MTSPRRAFIWLLLLCLAGGCVTRYQPRPLAPAETSAAFQARLLDDPALRQFLTNSFPEAAQPSFEWDLPLLTQVAFLYHPSLEVARAQWRLAQAAVQTAGGRPNPTLSVTPEYNFNAASGVSPWIPTLTVDWPVETAGKRGYRIARARYLAEASRQRVATEFWRVRGELRSALVDLWSARRRLELLRSELELHQDVQQLLEDRVKAGAASANELVSTRVNLGKARLDASDAERAMADARARTAEALGVPVKALDKQSFAFTFVQAASDAAEKFSPVEFVSMALTNRSDILAALAEYAAAQSALQLEIAKQYPDIHLGTGYQWDQGENKWSLGLSVEVPVLNRNEGPIAEAEAKREEARARFVELQARVIGEVERALAVLEVTAAQAGQTRQLLDLQRQQEAAAEAAFKAGASDRLETVSVRLQSSLLERQALETLVRQQEAVGRIETAIEAPLDRQMPETKEQKP